MAINYIHVQSSSSCRGLERYDFEWTASVGPDRFEFRLVQHNDPKMCENKTDLDGPRRLNFKGTGIQTRAHLG